MNCRSNLATSAIIVCSLFAANANALFLDANIVGVFTDTTFTTPAAGVSIDPSGDTAEASFSAGQGIIISIDVANPEADLITGIFVTLIVDGELVSLLGAAPTPSILAGGPVFMPTNLVNIGSGAVKANSPNPNGSAGDVWVQALAYGAAAGSAGTGPDIAAVDLFFVVTGASGADVLDFELTLTAGDGIGGASSTTFSSATFVVPEPGTALLLGMGLVALSCDSKRRASRSKYRL